MGGARWLTVQQPADQQLVKHKYHASVTMNGGHSTAGNHNVKNMAFRMFGEVEGARALASEHH